jgi:hypothetical protein
MAKIKTRKELRLEILKKTGHSKKNRCGRKNDNNKRDLRDQSGFIWLRTGATCGLL